MRDLKKRMYRYIRKCRRQGYSLRQIEKGLNVYGLEPWFAESLITSYKFRVSLYAFIIFSALIGLPLLAQPAITGYYFISPLNTPSSDKFLVSEYFLISLILLVIIPAYLMFYHLGIRERIKAIGSFESKILMERIKDFLSRLKKPLEHKNNENTIEEESYHETTPLSLMYIVFIGIGILGILASIVFQIWMMIFFSVIVIIISVIGHAKIKKMYYREV